MGIEPDFGELAREVKADARRTGSGMERTRQAAAMERARRAADSARASRRLSRGNLIAGALALVTLAALLTSPLWMVKTGQVVQTQRAKSAYANANHRGEVVRDGGLSFTVNALRCGVDAVGDEKPDHGQFCVFDLTVGNETGQAAAFNASAQRAYGSKGGFYVPDPVADAVANKASDTVPDTVTDPIRVDQSKLDPPVAPPLRPGVSRSFQIVYDLPVGVKLTQINLHANDYTRGAVVLL